MLRLAVHVKSWKPLLASDLDY